MARQSGRRLRTFHPQSCVSVNNTRKISRPEPSTSPSTLSSFSLRTHFPDGRINKRELLLLLTIHSNLFFPLSFPAFLSFSSFDSRLVSFEFGSTSAIPTMTVGKFFCIRKESAKTFHSAFLILGRHCDDDRQQSSNFSPPTV